MRVVVVPDNWRDAVRIIADVTMADVRAYLSPGEMDEVRALRNEKRRIERGASRIAGKLLIADVRPGTTAGQVEFVKENDRPVPLVDGKVAGYVSFTHAGGFGGAALGVRPVGLDLEAPREVQARMTKWFLEKHELEAAARLDTPNYLLHLWCAKEAAFKLVDRFQTLLKIPIEIDNASENGVTLRITGTEYRIDTTTLEAGYIAALAR